MAFISVPEQEPQEAHEEQEKQKCTSLSQTTQGKKGMKLPRINMAFSPQNLEYLNLIGRIEGISATEYVNRLIDTDREARQGTIEEARKILRRAAK